MFPDLEFIKTSLNAITAKFRRIQSNLDAVQANVDAVQAKKLNKQLNKDYAGMYLAIKDNGEIIPSDLKMHINHIVNVAYNSSTKKYIPEESYSTIKAWIDYGDTVVLKTTGSYRNIFTMFSYVSDGIEFCSIDQESSRGSLGIHSIKLYSNGVVVSTITKGSVLPNNNAQSNKGKNVIANGNFGYELSDLSNAVINSSTPGSTKQFKIMVDDSGTLTTTEVK